MQDIVYLVRPGENNEELRHSLRSLCKNYPNHGQVWFIGYKPLWVQHVRTIYKTQIAKKYINTNLSMLTACNHPDISDDFILMNDDFFIMSPISRVQTFHRGPIKDVIKKNFSTSVPNAYGWSMRNTEDLLKQMGYKNPLSYELHVPMVINKQKYIEVMKLKEQLAPTLVRANKRTLYGNYAEIGGEQIEDVKHHTKWMDEDSNPTPYLSSSDESFRFGEVGKIIKQEFPHPCRYEAIS